MFTNLKKLFVCLAYLFVVTQMHSDSFAQTELSVLQPDKPVAGEIVSGNSKFYKIRLESVQYLSLSIEVHEGSLDVKLHGANEKVHYEAKNLSKRSGVKTIYLISENKSDYRLEISKFADKKPRARYRINIKEIRSATERDRYFVSAEKAFAEGRALQLERKKTSIRNAIEKYKTAVSLFQSSQNLSRKSSALTNLGLAYYSLGETQDSLATFKKALEIARQTKDRMLEAEMLNNMGSIYDLIGDNENATEAFNQSLKIVRDLKMIRGEASILGNLASIYKVKGDHEKALDSAKKALNLFRKMGRKTSEANILNTLGAIFDDIGEPQKALGLYKQSLKIFRQSKRPRKQAVTLNNIGVVYGKLGDKKRALEVYLRVLTLVRKSGNRVGEAHTLRNIGWVYNYFNNGEKALDYLLQSLSLNRKIKNRLGESIALTSLGTTHHSLGNSQKALNFYQEALTIARQIEAKYQQGRILELIGKLFLSLSQRKKALDRFNQALSIWKRIGAPYQQSGALLGIATIEKEEGNLTDSEKHIANAVKIIENYRVKIDGWELRDSFSSTSNRIYKFYIDLLMQMHKQFPKGGFNTKAFNISEQARARSMVESLFASRIKIRKGVDAKLLKREWRIRKQLNKKESERIRVANRKVSDQKLITISLQIEELLSKYKDARTQIRINSPRYAELTQPRSLTLDKIQKSLDLETVLLEYSLDEKHSYVWVVKRNSITSVELPKSKEIIASANDLYSLLIARNASYKDKTREEHEESLEKSDQELMLAIQTLSKQIIAPISKQLDKKRIIFVAEGILQYIPFQVLSKTTSYSKQGYDPLVLTHEVVNLPSASILGVLKNKTTRIDSIPNSVGVIADPVFSRGDPRVAESIARLKNERQTQNVKLKVSPDESTMGELNRSADDLGISGFRRLRFSRREANDIVSFASKRNTFKAVDFAADRDLLLKRDLSKYQILHFATHGLLNNKNPELSGLVLSLVDEHGKSKDGFLRLHDIYNMKIGADLVVLSACQTALGKDIKGEGLIGLTRGFMYAGANSVVASLWKVEDRATAELMKKFYRAMLKDGQKPAAALRTAQIEMIREKQWNNPYYWAAFTFQGEWN